MKVPFPNPRLTQYLLRNASHYFKDAETYVRLREVFDPMSWWTLLDLAMPLITVIGCVITKKLPDIFSVLSFHKSFGLWADYMDYMRLRERFREWKAIVDAVGGPFITTNDSMYMAYVYADGIQRIHNETFSNVARRAGRVPP